MIKIKGAVECWKENFKYSDSVDDYDILRFTTRQEHEQTERLKVEQGYFLTQQDLAEAIRKAFEAGAEKQRLSVHAGTTCSGDIPIPTHVQAFIEWGEISADDYLKELGL